MERYQRDIFDANDNVRATKYARARSAVDRTPERPNAYERTSWAGLQRTGMQAGTGSWGLEAASWGVKLAAETWEQQRQQQHHQQQQRR